jgi:hypothetical protein
LLAYYEVPLSNEGKEREIVEGDEDGDAKNSQVETTGRHSSPDLWQGLRGAEETLEK